MRSASKFSLTNRSGVSFPLALAMATAATFPLIAPPAPARALPKRAEVGERTRRAGCGIALIAMAVVCFWPTVDNGFLPFGFDDAIIEDSPEIRELSWPNTWQILTSFNHAHYVPLTMLSLAADYSVWGLDPRGYHLTNVFLHALATLLLYVWLLGILPPWSAALAAGVFAVHPIQMEAVSVAIQRKTLLSGALFFATLIWYQHWSRRRDPWLYAAALITYAAAALAKPVVASLPCILLLYDYAFVERRWRVAHLLPFFAIAGATCLAAAAAHSAIGGTHGPHGGNLVVHALMVSRALLESTTALLVPLNLSPVYYYPKDAGYAPLNFVALIFIPLVLTGVTLQRARHPWPFFCVWWIALVCAPEANVFPLAQLRADRFMYLAVAGVGIGVAVAIGWLAERGGLGRVFAAAGSVIILALLAGVSYRSATVWRSDITAWTRVADRHSWSVTAHTMLGRAYLAHGGAHEAEQLFLEATRINPQVADPYLHLAQLYLDHGDRERAGAALDRVLELAPDDPEVQRLRELMQPTSRKTLSRGQREMCHS